MSAVEADWTELEAEYRGAWGNCDAVWQITEQIQSERMTERLGNQAQQRRKMAGGPAGAGLGRYFYGVSGLDFGDSPDLDPDFPPSMNRVTPSPPSWRWC